MLSDLNDPQAIHLWCLALGATAVTLKIGPDGVITGDGNKCSRGNKVNCGDATGVGDLFDGAFVARLATGDSGMDFHSSRRQRV